ncbi:aspartyl protease family protein [Haloferula sp. BvORR071]|uniref:retroviral-like aspartic protease family protein n=1 Tax=Haloferula sp. BvORR071 TaxID=1396141 RepID=UPI002240F15A|nr:aspartyl protease family protein [Haloferula sp. BvORR071]
MNELLRLACALALAGVAGTEIPAAPAEPSADAPAPIKLNWSHGLMTLPVEIQNKKGHLMVDTGAAATSLCDRLAKELDVTLKEVEGAQGKGIAGDLGKIMEGKVAISVPGQKADAFPKLSGTHTFIPIAAVEGESDGLGVIGLDDLSSAGALLDCVDGTMRLDPAGYFRAPDGLLEIPMTRRTIGGVARKEHEFLWSLPVRVNGKDGVMVVDTGAATTVLDDSFAKQAGVELAKSKAVAKGAGEGLKPLTEGNTEVVLGGTVSLGRITVYGTDLTAISKNTRQSDGSKVPLAGILGLDQIHRVHALLDCKRGVFFSAKEASPAEAADTRLIAVALHALVEHGDPQAIAIHDDAIKNQGHLELSSLEGGQLIARARSLGLLGDKAEVEKKADLATAIQKLAEHGDEEAKKLVTDAAAKGGKLALKPEQAEQLIARAREKGLLK